MGAGTAVTVGMGEGAGVLVGLGVGVGMSGSVGALVEAVAAVAVGGKLRSATWVESASIFCAS